VVKHAGLKRGALSYQEYVVRDVYIDAEGMKRYCLHEVATMPNFDESATVIDRDKEIALKYYNAVLTLTGISKIWVKPVLL
jgi:hypothetical protein